MLRGFVVLEILLAIPFVFSGFGFKARQQVEALPDRLTNDVLAFLVLQTVVDSIIMRG